MKTVVGVLVPTTMTSGGNTTTTWDFKYLKQKDLGTLDLCDDISQAFRFETTNVHPGDKNTADDWIEAFVNAPPEGYSDYTRNNFSVTSYSPLSSENEVKKVATSSNVVASRTYVNEMFNINSMGSGEDRNVFLTHKRIEGLPSRFAVKGQSVLNLNTSELINLGVYERSIRKKIVEDACADNYVYLNTSNGFH